MDLAAALQIIAKFELGEVLDPKSWHWVVDDSTGWFLHEHHPDFMEIKHIRHVRDGLSEIERRELDEALFALALSWKDVSVEEFRRASVAILLLLGRSETTISQERGYSIVDLPSEWYTDVSPELLDYVKSISFTSSLGGVVQSAREAVVYRMRAGKGDLKKCYLTRTVAIYFQDGDAFFVAFDDDPEENILLMRLEEHFKLRAMQWFVDAHDPMVVQAIRRAKDTHRIVRVTDKIWREDALVVAKGIVGDVAELYDAFLRRHLDKDPQAYMLDEFSLRNNKGRMCLDISDSGGSVLISAVEVGEYISATPRFGHARGVQKITAGNEGILVPYVGLLIYIQLGLIHSDPHLRSTAELQRMAAFFQAAERQLSATARQAFYAGLAATKVRIQKQADIQPHVDLWVKLAPAVSSIDDKVMFLSRAMRDPYYRIWSEHQDAAARFFAYIGPSRTKTKQFITALERIDGMNASSTLVPFFIYLLEQRPKQLLDILSKHTVLYMLEEGFVAQMEVLTALSRPITEREHNFARLRDLTSPMKNLDNITRTFFLQRISLAATSGLVPEGFAADIDMLEYSFIDAVYVLLFAMRGSTLGEAQKKLPGLQKKEDKLREMIAGTVPPNEDRQKMLRSTLQDISNQFFDIVLQVYMALRFKRLEALLARRFSCVVKKADEKAENPSFQNALLLLKNVRGEDEEEFCKALIQHYLSEQTVPFKEPADAYPWILPANKEWLARHSTRWQELFIEEYSVSQESMEGDNTEDRIRHHIEVAQRILGKLNIATLLQEKGIDIGKLSIPGLEQIYRELTLRENAGKYDETLLKNLRTQRDALRDLQGERKKREAKKITIVPEFDPLEILQMGNRVSGSCLSVDGSNKWSAIVNAMEVNKRVLWAKDESQNIIGRLLIAVDDSDQIVKFEIYYATHMKLNTYFDDYIRKLAERCNLGLNGKAKNVSNLVAKRWYRDPERNVQE